MATIAFMVLMLVASEVKADVKNDDFIEEIVVVGATVQCRMQLIYSRSYSNRNINANDVIYAGGYGGAALFNERGVSKLYTQRCIRTVCL